MEWYEGEYLNGELNGKGKKKFCLMFFVFEGEYLNGKEWNGKLHDENDVIECEIKNGNWTFNYDKSDSVFRLKGKYAYGSFIGKFEMFSDNSKSLLLMEVEYLTFWKLRNFDEDGILTFENEYLNGYQRRGKEYNEGILEYEGDYLYDRKWNGKGYDKNGNIIYELINGNGKVLEYDEERTLKFKGEYLNGKRNGKGREYNYHGQIIFEGEYLNGKRFDIKEIK